MALCLYMPLRGIACLQLVPLLAAGREGVCSSPRAGGERKLSEVLQLACLEPELAILDEIDSGGCCRLALQQLRGFTCVLS